MPGLGGNLSLVLSNGTQSKWLVKASNIKAVYYPGYMEYEINDPLLQYSTLKITVLALSDAEGMVVQFSFSGPPSAVRLQWVFGGASGKKFSRDGDIGADPESSFYFKEENCKDNQVRIGQYQFQLDYGKTKDGKSPLGTIQGYASSSHQLQLASSNQLKNPSNFLQEKEWGGWPLAAGMLSGSVVSSYLLIQDANGPERNSAELEKTFNASKAAAQSMASRITLHTPDSLLNNLGGALAIAADAIWEDPSYLHGAVAWRMRLNAWRGPYAADVLGWHDRARRHFTSYALSQLTTPPQQGVVMDTALHLARHLEKLGTALFSDGYICRNPGGDFRAHHYDMNLVFIDQLLNHFQWTGDTALVRQLFPLIKRHLAWEKRNFDTDGDGLYDAYAAIWASDALQYSGGGVAHSSAYNFRANRDAAILAKMLGENSQPFEKEALKIRNAVNSILWIKETGVLAEFKDLLGRQLLHDQPGIWTVYHTTDAELLSPDRNYQLLNYVNRQIPHLPLSIKGEADSTLFLLSTTNWQPYTWSLNNVALPENLQMALAYWQGGQPTQGFRLFRSALIESMYLGASPGNFQQLSFQDAARGELYRDFADPIGVAARSTVEGLFGIRPLHLSKKILVQPGYPIQWNHASLETPDFEYQYQSYGADDWYNFHQKWQQALALELTIPNKKSKCQALFNGRSLPLRTFKTLSGQWMTTIILPPATNQKLLIKWLGSKLEIPITDEPPFVNKKLQKDWGTSFEIQPGNKFEKIDISSQYNAKITDIFNNRYLSPRPSSPTLQLPVQGIGNWCYPLVQPVINDSGFRAFDGASMQIKSLNGIPFIKISDTTKSNIAYASQWDNYPRQIAFPMNAKASCLALLLTGSTNAMQSQLTNGWVWVEYENGRSDSLELRNPQNWWPIEQDYLIDGKAFVTGAPRPERLLLKQGKFLQGTASYTGIKGFSSLGIDGGAATVLYLKTNPFHKIRKLVLQAWANDVVLGLMAVTAIQQ
jgi:hypothetical protein